MRQIDWGKPLSDEDKAWARQAGLPRVEERITENEQAFVPVSPEVVDDYDQWTVAQLRSEIDKRNEDGAEIQVASDARKNHLIAALRADDESQESEDD